MGKTKQVYEINDLKLNAEDLMLCETIFHNANGYIGVRSCFEEGYPDGCDSIRGTYINGFYDIAEMKQAERLCGLIEEKQTMLNVADTQTILLYLEDERFSMFEGTVISSRRWLDMEQGITGLYVHWRSPSGREIELTVKRMASLCQLSLFTIEYRVKALNFSGRVKLVSRHLGEVMNYSNANDPRTARESVRYLYPEKAVVKDGASYLVSRTSRSGLEQCTGVKNILSKPCGSEVRLNGHSAEEVMEVPVGPGEEIVLVKYSVFADSIRAKDCLESAVAEMDKALGVPLDVHYEHQRSYLENYWDNCMLEIDGDEELNIAVRYNMYQLLQSAGKDEYCNIAAKGLSGEGYEGHYFWDTEMYIEPFFNLTNPEITRSLISFRYRTLDKARENARLLGHKKGALYPWRTIAGSECSGYFPSGTAGYHINGDIASSIIFYYLATGDFELIAEMGAEIVFETARLWIDMGCYSDGRFMINEVTGPDEYTCLVNNNYYTNVSAQFNLKWASRLYHMLKASGRLGDIVDKIGITEEEIKEFERAADHMYLPYDEKLKINPQDDSFLQKKVWDLSGTPKDHFPLLLHYHPLTLYRHQVCKQADTVLAHFLFEDAQDMETIRNSYYYYEKITTHDSSLSTAIFSIMASKLGDVDRAYHYFGNSAKLDLFNTHKNTKDGIHTANMGGNYMAIVYGFAGLRIKEDGCHFAPLIPKQWEGYRFKIRYRDSSLLVEVGRTETRFTLVSGRPQRIFVYGREYELKYTPIAVPMR